MTKEHSDYLTGGACAHLISRAAAGNPAMVC